MRFDNIIIGGGLSGLVAAIESQKAGRNTAIVSAGQSALHFWSGSFEFLGESGGATVIDKPLAAARALPTSHPYRKIGLEKLPRLLSRVAPLLGEAGIKVRGTLERNHYRLTPLGFFKPAWLTLDDYLTLDDPSQLKGKRIAIVNIRGFIDFFPRFLKYGLAAHGADVYTAEIDIPQLETLRRSTTEMRATNMSRTLTGAAIDGLARQTDLVARGADMVIMPAVLGIFSDKPVERFRQTVETPVHFIATTPASVPGVRCQLSLRDLFIRLGGTFMPGDTVERGEIEGNRVRRIFTRNFGNLSLEAENYVISTGSFFGHGLIANIERIYEPVFGLDLNVDGGRELWYDEDFYAPQPYMAFGVITDTLFRPSKEGTTIENLYATGALLAGFNALKEGCGAGITLATALSAASRIV